MRNSKSILKTAAAAEPLNRLSTVNLVVELRLFVV
jgi:hypothetical protein